MFLRNSKFFHLDRRASSRSCVKPLYVVVLESDLHPVGEVGDGFARSADLQVIVDHERNLSSLREAVVIHSFGFFHVRSFLEVTRWQYFLERARNFGIDHLEIGHRMSRSRF